MHRSEVVNLLRLRRQLTNETFSDDTVDAWQRGCYGLDYADAERALIDAARAGRVTLHALYETLPAREVPVPEKCELCDGTGWVDLPREKAHALRADLCHPAAEGQCRCEAAAPCRCTRGRQIAASTHLAPIALPPPPGTQLLAL